MGATNYVGSFEVSVLAHVALRMLSAITLASQWHFLANKHAVLAGCSAFWPVNCILFSGVASSIIGGGGHINIFVFCVINFFWNRLFLRSVNMNIWIWPPPNYRAGYATDIIAQKNEDMLHSYRVVLLYGSLICDGGYRVKITQSYTYNLI